MKLYDFELSGNCYKVRLLASILGLEYEKRPVDFYPGYEHESAELMRLNPLGQLPILEDQGTVFRDSQAILTYLALQYDASKQWYPVDDPVRIGEISQWLAFADSITATASAARLHDSFFYELDIEAARKGARDLFRILDEHLWFGEQENRDWICSGEHASIADIACFPYIMLSEDGGISRQDYPAIRRWCDRVKRIKGFVVMSGIFPSSKGWVENVSSPSRANN